MARPLLLARRMRTFMLTSIALGSILLGNLACMSEDDLGEDITLSSPDDEGKADSIEGRKITRVIRRAVYWAGTESVEGDMDVTSDTGTTVKLIGEMSVINLDRAKILELDVESRGFWQWVGRTTMGFQLVAHIGPFKSKDAAWNPTEWRTVECKGDDMETQQEAQSRDAEAGGDSRTNPPKPLNYFDSMVIDLQNGELTANGKRTFSLRACGVGPTTALGIFPIPTWDPGSLEDGYSFAINARCDGERCTDFANK